MSHGHVRPSADGSRTRCGGPGICAVCNIEAAADWPKLRAERDAARALLDRVVVEVSRTLTQGLSDDIDKFLKEGGR